MKKIILLFSLLCFFNKANAQEYSPMLEIGKIWNIKITNDVGNIDYSNIEVMETIEIEGEIYFRLEGRNFCETFLREDIIEKKVYGISEGEEYLHYDYNLVIGDIIWVNGNYWNVTGIGFGDFFGMENLKYFVLDDTLKLIEGIGLETIGIADSFEYACLNHPIYEFIELINMNQPLGINDVTIDKISIFPNPVQDILQIETSIDTQISSLSIFDTLGRIVLELNKPSNQIDVSNLTNGLFFVKIESNEGAIIKKVIKH